MRGDPGPPLRAAAAGAPAAMRLIRHQAACLAPQAAQRDSAARGV